MFEEVPGKGICPACGESASRPRGESEAPEGYLLCGRCGSVFSPRLIAAPLTAEEWCSVPRPEPSGRDAERLLRPFGGYASVALAGRADLDLMRAFNRLGIPVEACDMNGRCVSEGAKASLPVKFGLPSGGALDQTHDLIVVEGLLEYSSDPLSELAAVQQRLHQSGRARLEVPSAQGYLVKKRGARFSLFAPPAVRTLFSADGLTRLAARAGFRQAAVVHKNARAERWLIDNQYPSSYLERWITVPIRHAWNAPSLLVATARLT